MSSLDIKFSTDSEGFLTQECPKCERRFKVMVGDRSVNALWYCPYCGHDRNDHWWTKEQAEYIANVVAQKVVCPELDRFVRSINIHGRSARLMKLSASLNRVYRVRMPVELEFPSVQCSFECCNERIKHDGSSSRLFCIVCGREMKHL
jgi:ribosomal protein S27E